MEIKLVETLTKQNILDTILYRIKKWEIYMAKNDMWRYDAWCTNFFTKSTTVQIGNYLVEIQLNFKRIETTYFKKSFWGSDMVTKKELETFSFEIEGFRYILNQSLYDEYQAEIKRIDDAKAESWKAVEAFKKNLKEVLAQCSTS